MSFRHNLDRYAVFRVFKHQKRAVGFFVRFSISLTLSHFALWRCVARLRLFMCIRSHATPKYAAMAVCRPECLPTAKSCTLFTRMHTHTYTHTHTYMYVLNTKKRATLLAAQNLSLIRHVNQRRPPPTARLPPASSCPHSNDKKCGKNGIKMHAFQLWRRTVWRGRRGVQRCWLLLFAQFFVNESQNENYAKMCARKKSQR